MYLWLESGQLVKINCMQVSQLDHALLHRLLMHSNVRTCLPDGGGGGSRSRTRITSQPTQEEEVKAGKIDRTLKYIETNERDWEQAAEATTDLQLQPAPASKFSLVVRLRLDELVGPNMAAGSATSGSGGQSNAKGMHNPATGQTQFNSPVAGWQPEDVGSRSSSSSSSSTTATTTTSSSV